MGGAGSTAITMFKILFLVRSHFQNKHVQLSQGSHSLEKYFNLEGFLEKPLKIKYASKSTGKSLENTLNSSIFCRTVDRDLSQYKIAVPLFGAATK